ncbi:unnamed protein product [Lepidochelys olivacea]
MVSMLDQIPVRVDGAAVSPPPTRPVPPEARGQPPSCCEHLQSLHSEEHGSDSCWGRLGAPPGQCVQALAEREWGLRGEARSGVTHKQPSNREGRSLGVKSGGKVPGLIPAP